MKTCLVVDDSSVIRKSRKAASWKGWIFAIIEAEDGEKSAGRPAKHGLPDAVLLDWNMPVMGRLRIPAQSAPHARRRSAQSGVLHHRETTSPHIARALPRPAPTNTS